MDFVHEYKTYRYFFSLWLHCFAPFCLLSYHHANKLFISSTFIFITYHLPTDFKINFQVLPNCYIFINHDIYGKQTHHGWDSNIVRTKDKDIKFCFKCIALSCVYTLTLLWANKRMLIQCAFFIITYVLDKRKQMT